MRALAPLVGPLTARAGLTALLVSLSWLAASSAVAKAAPSAPVPQVAPLTVPANAAVTAERTWGDGQDRLFVLRGDLLVEHRRGQPPRDHRLPARQTNTITAMTGAGQGDALVLVVWDNAGRALRLRGDVWESALLPADLRDHPCLGAVDAAGTFACVKRDGALVLWSAGAAPVLRSYDRESRSVVGALPSGETDIRAITAGPPGTFYLTEHQHVLELREGRYRALSFSRLGRLLPSGPLGIWYSGASGLLWVTGPYQFIALDLKTGQVRDIRSPEALKPEDLKEERPWRDLRGVHSRGQDLLWVSNPHEAGVYLCDGRSVYFESPWKDRWHQRHFGKDHLRGSALLVPDATLYVVLDHGVSPLPVEMPALGTGKGRPMRPPRPDTIPVPFATVGLGPRWGLDSADRSHSLALDLSFGLNFMRIRGEMFEHAGLWVAPQLGYSYGQSANLFTLGMGVGYGSALVGVMYTPRLITGTPDDERVVGFRHGLAGHLLLGFLSIEVAHQVMPRGGRTEQDLRLMVNLNPLLPVVGAVASATVPAWLPLLLKAFLR